MAEIEKLILAARLARARPYHWTLHGKTEFKVWTGAVYDDREAVIGTTVSLEQLAVERQDVRLALTVACIRDWVFLATGTSRWQTS